ncbi:MAG: hypothetical protein WBE20_02635 [Candidatus Acidiferrales bacterium]
MRDWRNEVEQVLAAGKFSAAEREEISLELAGYLDDLYHAARNRGLDEAAAIKYAFAELHEDARLGQHLRRAREENTMNDRTKRLWLPGLTILLSSVVLLETFQAIGFSGFFFRIMMQHSGPAPNGLMRLVVNRDAGLLTYFVWLLGLQFLGAAGASWSRRAGSGRALQIATGLFPLLLFFAVALAEQAAAHVGTLSTMGELNSLAPGRAFFLFPSGAGLFLSWVVIPGVALLLGILPFLRSNTAERRIA